MSALDSMNSLEVGLAAWIIQDGNYDDFSVGQEASFALEFHSRTLRPTQPESKKLHHVGRATYSIHGRVEFVCSEAWVTDFGLRAYCDEKLPPDTIIGTWVQGEIYLGVDHFYYFETLKKIPDMPSLTCRWKIKNIQLETTPWLRDGNMLFRDSSRESFRNIERTDAWNDDGGRGHYLLTCERIDSF
jgi:hypothetical protein